MRVILGIQVGDREHDAIKLQELLTKNGCLIKTRLGLHETPGTGQCSSKGLILLELFDDKLQEINSFEKELAGIETLTVRKMEF